MIYWKLGNGIPKVDPTKRDGPISSAQTTTPAAHSGRALSWGSSEHLWKTLHEYTGRLSDPDTQYQTWTAEDEARYAVCGRHGRAAVIRSKLVSSAQMLHSRQPKRRASNTVGAKVVRQNFGMDFKFIRKHRYSVLHMGHGRQSKYFLCCRFGSAAVVRSPKLIIVTANNVGAKTITRISICTLSSLPSFVMRLLRPVSRLVVRNVRLQIRRVTMPTVESMDNQLKISLRI